MSSDVIDQRESWSISELSRDFAVTARALRFYEDEGLIAPARVGTARVYSRRDRARLAWIIRARNVGFSLAEVREMIDLYDLGDGRVEQQRVALAKCRERVAQLTIQRGQIDETIAELQQFIQTVEALELPRPAIRPMPRVSAL